MAEQLSFSMNVATASVRRKGFVLVVAAALLVFGLLQLGNTKVDSLPEFNPTVVEVQTEALGLSAAEVEQLITVPLEADLLNGVAWMETIESQSLPGLSSIVMTFEPGTDLLRARQVVQERLTQAAGLPNVSRAPAMVQPLSSEARVMMIGLSSDELSVIEQSVLARWTVRPFLMGVNGVANVSVWGQRERQLQVLVDPAELAAADLTLLDIVKTTGNALWTTPLSYLEASTPGTGGFIDGPNQRIGVQHVFSIDGPADLAAVPLEAKPDVLLGDVVTIVEDHQPLIGDAIVGDGDGLLLIVEKFPWANSAETTDAVLQAMDDLAPGLTGINVDTGLFRPARYVERSVDNIQRAALLGLALAAVVLALILWSWRAVLISLTTVVLSLTSAALVLYALDTTVNIMVMAGLALATALIVNDSVSDAASVQQGFHNRRLASVWGSTRRPLIYGTVVLFVIATPAFAMRGAPREFLPVVALSMGVALVVSIIVGMTVTPAMASVLYRNADASAPVSPVLAKMDHGFERLMAATSGNIKYALGAMAVVAIAGIAVIPGMKNEFVPQFQQTDLLVQMEGAPGTSLRESGRLATQVANELRSLPGVENVGVQVGRAVLSEDVVNVNSSELWVNIGTDADYDKTIASLNEVINGYPGFGRTEVITYANGQIDDVLRQSSEDLVVRVYGENPVILSQTANDVAALVAGIDGAENVRARQPISEPTIEIEVDLVRAAEFQIKPGDVRRAAATLLSGIEVGSFFEEQKVFEVVVWSKPELRNSVTDVENLLIDTPSGDIVRLADVAEVRVAPNAAVINRDAVSRYIDVVGDVPNGNMSEIEDAILDAVALTGLPFEYHLRILDDGGASSSQTQTLLVAITAAIAAYLVLQAAFNSWRLAFLLVALTPLAVVGGLLTTAIFGNTYSIGTAIGLFAIAGITLRIMLGLVERFEWRQLNGHKQPLPEAVRSGVLDHVNPTISGLLAVATSMIPLVIFGNIAGYEIVRPMAIAILGGVLTAALITLFVLPAMYLKLAEPPVHEDDDDLFKRERETDEEISLELDADRGLTGVGVQ